jgi:hypothetical protein
MNPFDLFESAHNVDWLLSRQISAVVVDGSITSQISCSVVPWETAPHNDYLSIIDLG